MHTTTIFIADDFLARVIRKSACARALRTVPCFLAGNTAQIGMSI
jgi:hypothetical protein